MKKLKAKIKKWYENHTAEEITFTITTIIALSGIAAMIITAINKLLQQ